MAKVRVIEQKKEKQFEPFTIEITVENQQELWGLWHKMNTKQLYRSESDTYLDKGDLNTYEAWKYVDNEVKKYS